MSLLRPIQNDGQGYNTPDVQLKHDVLAHADDRVYEAMLTPPAAGKQITPVGVETATYNPRLLLQPSGTAGKVTLQPCLLVAGSALAAVGLSGLLQSALDSLAFGANSSGNPRIDLVYVTLSRTAPQVAISPPPASVAYVGIGPAVTGAGPFQPRPIKDTTSGQVSNKSINLYDLVTVQLNILAGTPAGSPVAPALPADGAGSYNFSIAQVAIANGYAAGAAIAQASITPTWTGGWIPPQLVRGNDHVLSLYAGSANEKPSTPISSRWGALHKVVLICKVLSTTPTAIGSAVVIDNSIDWRQRVITGKGFRVGPANVSLEGTAGTPCDQRNWDESTNAIFDCGWSGAAGSTFEPLLWFKYGASGAGYSSFAITVNAAGNLVLYNGGTTLVDTINGDLMVAIIEYTDQLPNLPF
ncbi:MAG: hypothetical protein ACHQWU_09095 [Gemmatimonadales bacterium]